MIVRLTRLSAAASVVVVAGACRLFGIGLPCDDDAHCDDTAHCAAGVCTAGPPTQAGEGESDVGEGEGEGEGEPSPARTCLELLAEDPDRASGTYPVLLDDGSTMDIACEMNAGSGGWTLAGRSTASPVDDVTFGFHAVRGDVADLDTPYALDVARLGARADQLLVTRVTAAGASIAPRFIVQYGDDLLAPAYSAAPIARAGRVRVLVAGCAPDVTNGEPLMLNHTGCHDVDTTHFHLRDNDACTEPYGLGVNGWDLNSGSCQAAGELDGAQGAVWFREAPSCRALHAKDPTLPTGLYSLFVPGRTARLSVWCDMDVDGGGWTLVARSVAGGASAFGWRADRGAPDNFALPYAINFNVFERAAVELLVTDIDPASDPDGAGAANAPGPRRFVLGFLDDVTDDAHRTGPLARARALSVGTACTDGALPTALSAAGCNGTAGVYRFGDSAGCGETGLFADGFDFTGFGETCESAGELGGRQGLVFVR